MRRKQINKQTKKQNQNKKSNKEKKQNETNSHLVGLKFQLFIKHIRVCAKIVRKGRWGRAEKRALHREILRSAPLPRKASLALNPLLTSQKLWPVPAPLTMEGTLSLLVTSYNGATPPCEPESAPVVLIKDTLKCHVTRIGELLTAFGTK